MALSMLVVPQIDTEIQPLVRALREANLDTDWSCAGEEGHMCIRLTVQIRTCPFPDGTYLLGQRREVERIMAQFGIEEYWLSLVFTYGQLNTHGGEPTWLLQIPGRFDHLALPAALSSDYTQGDNNLVVDYSPPRFEENV